MRNIVAELRALADREGLGLPDEAADEIERLRPVAARYEELRSIIDGGSESMTHKDAIAEVKYLQSRVAELEAARGEPVAWQYKVTCDGKGFVDWKAWEQEERPAKIGRWDAEYRALYTAPPAPAVDVNSISDDRIKKGLMAFYGADAVNKADSLAGAILDMRAALRAIFNTKDK